MSPAQEGVARGNLPFQSRDIWISQPRVGKSGTYLLSLLQGSVVAVPEAVL